ncbi:MAG: hypothetical protein HQL50_14235 [Magnetococcales bacterium]|nr:hypothetical protein [Magnetococcales bacterium]
MTIPGHAALGAEIGQARETVSRRLKELVDEGVLTANRGEAKLRLER